MSNNWKNVNNWHWVNKNCLKWAQKYLAEELEGLSAESNGYKVELSKLEECVGDVDLNQRKGKIITIYDVALKLRWQGTLADGSEASGRISIPEVAHDSTADDYVFEISVDGNVSSSQEVKSVIRKQLTPLICDKLAKFPKDMIKTHGSDVYIEPTTTPGQTDVNQCAGTVA
ncbi:hypothetical protein VTP01DRAFT_366 [Rhizomucor pusillus]|uniref:uncharacterized protein n=1 Tax=Rhizomucor pusillus TaxID=4840 RepID=UPI0037446B20